MPSAAIGSSRIFRVGLTRRLTAKVCDALVRENALRVSTWIDLLRPATTHLNPELARIYGATPDATRSQTQIDLATEVLETYAASDDPNAIDPIAPIYFTILVFAGGDYEMGEIGETESVTVPGPFAVSDREVTWRQFSPIDGDSHRQDWEKQFKQELSGRRLQPDEPVFGVSWFDAVNYCRWLTESKMPGEENQSYAKKELASEQTKRGKGWVDISDQTQWEWPIDPTRPGFRLLRDVVVWRHRTVLERARDCWQSTAGSTRTRVAGRIGRDCFARAATGVALDRRRSERHISRTA